MNTITLTFTAEETNALLNVLGEMPTKLGVYPLVQKIYEQAQAQLQAAPQDLAVGGTD